MTSIKRMFLFHVMSAALITTTVLSAQAQNPARYTITDLGTFGGTYSYSYGVNNAGMVSGGAATPDQTDGIATTAFVWSKGHLRNLGTLGGAACPSCISENAATNSNGLSVVISETSAIDRNGEDFCGFGNHRQCLAAKWKDGVLSALPVLEGGNNSQVYWLNNEGTAIGFSETGVPDDSCVIPNQVMRFEAVKWDRFGVPQPLRPLVGDTVSFGLGINERGQAVGVSGLCSNTTVPPSNPPSGPHAVLWDKDGIPIDLGTLAGGVGNNVATSINNHGDVVGTQAMSDGTVHAFLWNRAAGLRDLGLFPDSFVTVAPCCNSINNHGELAGFAFGADGPVAFVWKEGTYTNLNTLIPADAPWYLLNAASINDAGQIAGFGVRTDTGEVHAFLATPIAPEAAPNARGEKRLSELPHVQEYLDQHFRSKSGPRHSR
jgi:probable HAF family extracellular repeat protein